MPANWLKGLFSEFSLSEVVTEIMHGIMIFSFLLLIVRFLSPEQTALILIWQLAAFLIFWVLRNWFGHIWQFFLTGVLVVGLPITPLIELPLIPTIVLVAGLLFLAIRSFAIRLSPINTEPSSLVYSMVAPLILILLLNLLAAHLELTEVSRAFFYLSIIYIMLGVFRWHAVSLAEQMDRFTRMPTQPARRILRFNQFLLLVFAGVMIILLLLAPSMRIHDVFPWLGGLFLAFLRWLARQTSGAGPDEPPDTTVPPDQQGGIPDMIPIDELMPDYETARWAEILYDILYYLFSILIVIGLIALFVFAFYVIYRQFYSRQKSSDLEESLVPKMGEDIREQVLRVRKRWAFQFGQSPEQKIRRHYWRLVERLVSQGVERKTRYSPRQFAGYLKTFHALDLDELTQIYEKARYGPGPCTADDVSRMQSLCQAARKKKVRPLPEEKKVGI